MGLVSRAHQDACIFKIWRLKLKDFFNILQRLILAILCDIDLGGRGLGLVNDTSKFVLSYFKILLWMKTLHSVDI